jgi:hypothetical protein
MKPFVTVVVGMAALGVALGAVWVGIAPPVHGVVALTKAGERAHVYLGNEADHFFVAAVIMVGVLVGAAVVSAVAAWQWRQHRGPWMVVALTVGGMAAAGAATGVGAALGWLRYGAVDIAGAPVSPEHRVYYVTEAASVFFGHAPLVVAATVVLPAVAAALTYAAMASGSADDDLGVNPSVAQAAG